MFNQDKFANILKKINETYDTMTDFGKKASFDRTYISKYINKKLINPPTPKILEKIAKASNGITDYNELMQICGYLNVYNSNDINIFTNNISQEKPTFFLEVQYEDNLSKEETLALQEIYELFKNYLINDKNINWDIIKNQKNLYYHKLSNKENLEKQIQLILDTTQAMQLSIENEKKKKLDILGNPVVPVPLLGVVKAGYDYLAQENWIGTIDVDKDLIKDGSEYFALTIKGDSMSPVLIENDTVIIKKQDDFENGDIVVAIVNGDEATIKKGKKSENSILLQPLNTNYEPLIFTYDEMKTIPVIIVGIVKQLKREF